MTETISLIPALANPKNLFGFLGENRGAKVGPTAEPNAEPDAAPNVGLKLAV